MYGDPDAIRALARTLTEQGEEVRAQGRRLVAAIAHDGEEIAKNHEQEPSHPDAFAFASFADFAHPVVPVAAAHQRQAVRSQVRGPVEHAAAMFIERSGFG